MMFNKFSANFAPEGVAAGGSGDTGAPPAAASATDTAKGGAAAASTQGSGGAVDSGSWYAALDEDTRKTAEAKGWKSPTDAVKSYNELFTKFSSTTANTLALPGSDASAEAWNEVYTKLGRPETPEGYQFAVPEGLPADLPYDQTLAANSKNWAHEAGLSPKQAQVLHDRFAAHQAAQFQSMQETSAKQVQEAHGALQKLWGDESSVEYKRNQELANRAIRHQGGDDLVAELKTLGALDVNGRVRSPRIAQAFAKIGEAMYAEDAVYAGPGGMENPFAPGPSEHMGKQGELIRRDPKLAVALMRQAGIDPASYGMR